jgi:hypothetical protein
MNAATDQSPANLENFELFIDGKYVPAISGKTFDTVDR